LIQSGRVGITGTTAVGGELAYSGDPRVQIHGIGVDQPGHLVVSQVYVDAVGAFDLVASGPISLGGSVVSRGDILVGIPFDMGAGAIGFGGTVGITGNVLPIYSTFTAFGRDRIGKRHEHDPDPRIGRATLLGGIPRIGTDRQ
jgi:hypothetical protein